MARDDIDPATDPRRVILDECDQNLALSMRLVELVEAAQAGDRDVQRINRRWLRKAVADRVRETFDRVNFALYECGLECEDLQWPRIAAICDDYAQPATPGNDISATTGSRPAPT